MVGRTEGAVNSRIGGRSGRPMAELETRRGVDQTLSLRVRIDGFSLQVSRDEDPRFWFRLEPSAGQDTITDFSTGAADPALGGHFLWNCYVLLGRVPQPRIVFRDIFSSGSGRKADEIARISETLTKYAGGLLTPFRRRVLTTHLRDRDGKVDLIVDTVNADSD